MVSMEITWVLPEVKFSKNDMKKLKYKEACASHLTTSDITSREQTHLY
jgi:hypothetical protein